MFQGGMIYRKVNRAMFLEALGSAKAGLGDKGLCVSEPAELADLYLAADGLSGFALHGCAFGAAFSMVKGRLAGRVRAAKAHALRAGFSQMHLDCFEPLAAIYARHGWVETGRDAFDWQYAPDGWASRHGEPALIYMALPLMAMAA
jgi:hypothetical protein